MSTGPPRWGCSSGQFPRPERPAYCAVFDLQTNVRQSDLCLCFCLVPILIPVLIGSFCSYHEALPFMLSVPLFTISQASRVLVTNSLRLGTLLHIRNLRLNCFFFDFPQFGGPESAPWNMPGWIQTCHTISSMRSLRYLCVFITQESFSWWFRIQPHEKSVELIRELLEPLRSIEIPLGGCFDVITQDWKLPYELSDDMPFRLIQESPPSLVDLASRTMELGHVSQDAYVKLTSMPRPPAYRPSPISNFDLVFTTPTKKRSRFTLVEHVASTRLPWRRRSTKSPKVAGEGDGGAGG